MGNEKNTPATQGSWQTQGEVRPGAQGKNETQRSGSAKQGMSQTDDEGCGCGGTSKSADSRSSQDEDTATEGNSPRP